MNKKRLLQFIANAHRYTYAAPSEIAKKYFCKNSILPNHYDYEFSEGGFTYHDSYAGKAWAPGREVIFWKGKPVWAMSYQGKTDNKVSSKFIENSVFPFLKLALSNFSDDFPFRGPQKFRKGDFEYNFSITGDYSYFIGIENVLFKGKLVFMQNVQGSLIK